MGNVDWNKVAEDYKKSSFNRAELDEFAQNVVKKLLQERVPFDGYTGGSFGKEQTKGIANFFKSLVQTAPATNSSLASQHLGYWVLETSNMEGHFGRLYEESYMDKNYYIKYKSTGIFIDQANIEQKEWLLLENGELAVHTKKVICNKCVPESSVNAIKYCGSAALSFIEVKSKEKSVDDQNNESWDKMTQNDLLLLDHKSREVKSRHVQKKSYDIREGTCIKEDNYLLTGKKGGGCKKRMQSLLKKYNIN